MFFQWLTHHLSYHTGQGNTKGVDSDAGKRTEEGVCVICSMSKAQSPRKRRLTPIFPYLKVSEIASALGRAQENEKVTCTLLSSRESGLRETFSDGTLKNFSCCPEIVLFSH
jgi:hypothetical protein